MGKSESITNWETGVPATYPTWMIGTQIHETQLAASHCLHWQEASITSEAETHIDSDCHVDNPNNGNHYAK